tara:strand:- start:691 stop:888 length:198 start_codon:yes stop_codon:yes gene_type:complete
MAKKKSILALGIIKKRYNGKNTHKQDNRPEKYQKDIDQAPFPISKLITKRHSKKSSLARRPNNFD